MTLRFMFLLAALSLSPMVSAIDKITVLGLFKDKAIVTIDGKQRILKAGQSSPEGVKLIAANSEQATIEIAGKVAVYKLGTHIGTHYAKPDEGRTVQVWPDTAGMYGIVGSINGFPVNFLIDTGATLIAMNRNEARRLGIDYLVNGLQGRSSTASGVVTTYYVYLKRVKVGEIELRDVEAAVVDGDFPTDVLLGNSFLNRLDMRREGRMLELKTKP